MSVRRIVQPLQYLGRNGIGSFVHLAISESCVVIDNGYIVGRGLCLLLPEREDRLRVVVRNICPVESVKNGRLFGIEQRDGPQCDRIVGSKSRDCICDRLSEAGDQFGAVQSVVVLDRDARHAVNRHDIEGYLEFRHVELHRFVSVDRFAEDAEVADNAHLVSEHYFRLDIIVGSNACKRVVLVRECGIEALRRLTDELLDGLCAYLCGQREGVDKHTHRIADAQVVPSVGYGGEADVVVGREA